MLKKLRVKFIALNMATVAVVLAVVFTAICVIDYQQSVARVHETLDAALAHAGDAGGGPSSGTQPGAQVPADAARANGMPPEIGGKRGGSDPAIPVAVFSVEADGSLAAVQTRTTASIADDVLAQAAAALADQPDGSGSLVGLRAVLREAHRGRRRVPRVRGHERRKRLADPGRHTGGRGRGGVGCVLRDQHVLLAVGAGASGSRMAPAAPVRSRRFARFEDAPHRDPREHVHPA